MDPQNTKKRGLSALAAGLLGLTGLVTAGFAAMWVAGTLGVSTSTAARIVDAIVAGGWALSVVMSIFGAGVIGAILSAVRALIQRAGREAAIA